MNETRASDTGERAREREPASVWERIVAGGSTVLVLAAVGYVFYMAVASPDTPPQVIVEVEDIHPGAVGYVVEFWAINRGGTTAKDLAIEGQLVSDTGMVATRSTAITFVPAGSRRKGGLFFPVDSRLYELRLYPVGYDVP